MEHFLQFVSIPELNAECFGFSYSLSSEILVGEYNSNIFMKYTFSGMSLLYSGISYIGGITLALNSIGYIIFFCKNINSMICTFLSDRDIYKIIFFQ